jgi:hypothetical protein
MPPLGRTAHYFSRGEYHTALLLLWLGVDDLREQFPLWPAPHPHPLYGSPLQSNAPLTWAKGLLSIAEEAGIAHGVEVGTRVPYIASLDLLATVTLPTRIALAAFSSKPIPNAGSAVSWRTRERLEVERRYAEDVGSSYFVSHSALIPCIRNALLPNTTTNSGAPGQSRRAKNGVKLGRKNAAVKNGQPEKAGLILTDKDVQNLEDAYIAFVVPGTTVRQAFLSMSAACYSKGHTIKHGHAVSNCHDVRVCFSPLASRWTPRCCNIAWHVLRAGDVGRRQRVGPDVAVRTYCG